MFFQILICFLINLQNSYAEEYAIREVQAVEAEKFASIRFGDEKKHLCLGVVLGRRTIMTSSSCLNSYIPVYSMLNEGFRESRCSVQIGVKNEDEKANETATKICKRFVMNNRMWWSWGSKFEYEHPVKVLVDFPMETDPKKVIEIAPPFVTGFKICKVYGWAPKDMKAGENSTKALMSTVAMLLNDSVCTHYSKERLKINRLKNQFCVEEGRISDEGRILVCDKKLLGIFARRVPPLYGKEIGNVSLYTYASAGESPEPYYVGSQFSTYLNFLFVCSIIWYM